MRTRRNFIATVGAAGAVSVFGVGESLAQQGPLRTRKNIVSLTPDEIASLERGVLEMKRRPKQWPTSWAFQANIHGIVREEEAVVYRGWDGCQHGNWWFLPWHRIYLYYFEQILREASGDANLTLPYWDWTRADQRSLPAPFLDPRSPLYEPNRSFEANDGGELSESAVQWERALDELLFSTPYPQRGFGGQEEPQPGAYRPHGAIESLAHDGVHDQVGGLMGDPRTAARDPIFWLHHANVDRLWGEWLRTQDGRSNPSDPVWLDTSFDFYGRTGRWGQVTARQVIDSASLLQPYRYDTEPQGIGANLAAQGAVVPPNGAGKRPEQPSVTLSTQMPPRRELGKEPVSITLPLSPESRKVLEEKTVVAAPPGVVRAESPSVRLSVDDIRFSGSPGRLYEVYLNLPDSSEATGPKSPYFAGTLSFFGLHAHHGGGHAPAPAAGASQVIDVTEAVARLRAQGKLMGDLKVTLVEQTMKPNPRAVGLPRRGAAPVPPPAPAPVVSIGAIRLLMVGE